MFSTSEMVTVVFVVSFDRLSIFCATSLLYCAFSLFSIINFTISETSLSETNAPCTRRGFGTPCGSNNISPFPRSFSAPFISSMVRLSTPLVTANAIRLGIFALMRPVITLTEGLCVAIIRCIPAALASCASLHIASSTSFDATIIRSASSSTIMTICGIFGGFSVSLPSIASIMAL